MTVRIHSALLALVMAGSLSACGGGGGGGGGGSTAPASPVVGTDLRTLQNQLGVSSGQDKRMRAATSYGGHKDGTFRVDQNPARMTAGVDGFNTPAVSQRTPTTVVMDGQTTRVNGTDSVFYVPRTGSNMHVGMVHRSTGEGGFAGVFGNETGAGAIGARAAAGGRATYAGVTEYTQGHGMQATGYRGQMTATANFDTAGLTYGSGAMAQTTDTGGPATMRINGTGTFAGNGQITGTFTTTPATGAGTTGTTRGGFYGPTGQNIGMVFSGTNGAGAAILNEAR